MPAACPSPAWRRLTRAAWARRYAELLSDQRTFSEDELALFQRSARSSYEDFRNKAALSRGMAEARMEEKAQVGAHACEATEERTALAQGVAEAHMEENALVGPVRVNSKRTAQPCHRA